MLYKQPIGMQVPVMHLLEQQTLEPILEGADGQDPRNLSSNPRFLDNASVFEYRAVFVWVTSLPFWIDCHRRLFLAG